MNSIINRIGLAFLALFAISVVVIFTYQTVVVAPVQTCESAGNWWDPQSHSCAHVVYLPDITHRRPGAKGMPVYPTLPQSRGEAATATSAPPPVSTAPLRR
jgi:hypothetical protein